MKHRVRDLSPHGMRIDHADGLGRGATVLVAVGLLSAVPATIQWVKDGQAGLAFRVKIDPDQARGKVAIALKAEARAEAIFNLKAPTAGWLPDLESPYRGR